MAALINPPTLSVNAKLRDLSLIDFQVSESTPCENIVRRLEDDSSLSGVIVVDSLSRVQGMLTRRAILEWMLSKPYGLDVFLKRPISSMVEFHQRGFLLLPGDSDVIEAASRAFQRPEETIYDPVVVQLGSHEYRLLDVPVLLVAQAQVHLATQQKLREQQQEMQLVLVALEQEKNRSLQYAQDLERQKAEILSQNLALEVERRQAQERSEELARLNARILEISAVLSEKGQSTFAATFEGVEAVRSLTGEITASSQELSRELREIGTIVDLIVEVAGYIRLLSFNAAVEANRSSSSVGGFGAIAQEIRKLAGRTTEASNRIRSLAERIQRKSQSTLQSAQASSEVVQSLYQQAQSAQSALEQLQTLLERAQD
ncbi:methyl-accepting chemotaxis protein [Synechococcus sp. Nb3U1]|uniref:methyl-accepting chemotaxis protein n=1 Tax=Synechococcus sp. Nb3U1 TaxID=1914529 RepID=UPI001F437AC0|nr:methyl-accepting chemotaxis protein [Synechococcus sp. Nb3U1]MCF2972576.1 methyl-accepting chemotaxis protein [Synechococcus sp. Nb3U1]